MPTSTAAGHPPTAPSPPPRWRRYTLAEAFRLPAAEYCLKKSFSPSLQATAALLMRPCVQAFKSMYRQVEHTCKVSGEFAS